MVSVTCILAAIGVLLPWGLGTTSAPLILFAILWGMTALSLPGLWSKIITPICKDDPTLPGLVFSIFAMLRGIGNVTAGPISTKLLQTDAFRGAIGAYGTNFVSSYWEPCLLTYSQGCRFDLYGRDDVLRRCRRSISPRIDSTKLLSAWSSIRLQILAATLSYQLIIFSYALIEDLRSRFPQTIIQR